MLETSHEQVIGQLGLRFGFSTITIELMKVACRHRSWINEQKNLQENEILEANERLEFLGDSILGFIVAKKLYEQLPQADEGTLSKVKAQLVSAVVLAEFAREFQLGKVMLLGRGEETSGGRERVSLLANTLEAIIGAVYLGEGIKSAEQFVLSLWQDELAKVDNGFNSIDYKTQLQEYTQKIIGELPSYTVERIIGPDHQRCYEVSVKIEGVIYGQGQGSSKKQAAQVAAAEAYKNLQQKTD